MPARPTAAPRVGRRTAVLGLAAGVLLAGCDHGDDIGKPNATATTTADASADPSPSAREQTADERLVDEVVGGLDGAIAVLVAARRHRELRPVLTPLLKAHRQHVEALQGEATETPAATPASYEDVQHSERRLQAALVEAAGKAESGALAKLLASMSASVTQHLDALPKAA